MTQPTATLARRLSLTGLVATGVCSMIGVAINTIPFTMQRSVPGIGPNVLLAFVIAAIPAFLAGLAFAVLASAMPNAGGTYVYASRALSPYLGFVASFSQWLAICVGMGIVSYLLMPFLRDLALALGARTVAAVLDQPAVRIIGPLALIWAAAYVNIRGIRAYQRTVVPLMFLTLAIGAVVIVAGFSYTHAEFEAALLARNGVRVGDPAITRLPLSALLSAVPVIFACFIGFESIAQAGGEAADPRRLPLAILIAVVGVAAFYLLFTAAVYHAVPWRYVADQAMTSDVTAPGLLGYLLPRSWAVIVLAGMSVALVKDLPAMLMGISRLPFAWAEDGIFPAPLAAVHEVRRTPYVAIMVTAVMASLAVMGCALAGDFLRAVDVAVTAILVNYVLMSLSVLTLPRRNAVIASRITALRGAVLRDTVAALGMISLGALLLVQCWRDLHADHPWYLSTTWGWVVVVAVGTALYVREVRRLRNAGVDLDARFREAPSQ